MPSFVKEQLEEIETMSLEQLHQTIEFPLLKKQLDFANENSEFWKAWFKEAGIDVEDIRTLSDYQQLPLCDKKDLLDDQANKPPFGSLLAVGVEKLSRIHRTSGSTDKPLFILLTANDVSNTVLVGSRAFRCAGVTSEDTVIHCLNYCMWSGGVTDHQCIEKTGATVIPFGVGNSKYLIQTIMRLRPTAISCTPSYFSRLEELLLDEFNAKPRSLGLKKAVFGGELGLQDPEYRAGIEEKWGLKAIDANYGVSDVISIIGSECSFHRGLHFHGQGIVMPELIDSDKNSVPLVKGNSGELVLSCLLKEGQPLFRYRTHDVIKIVDTEVCSCGRSGFLFKVMGRTDNMIVVKGINFFPNCLQGMFKSFEGVLTGEYRVVVGPKPYKPLGLQVELVNPEKDEKLSGLKARIEDIVRTEHSVRVKVNFVPKGTFVKSENKTSRLIRK